MRWDFSTCYAVKIKTMENDNLKLERHADAKPVLVVVNYSAIGTWLEPWIGWKFEVVKTSKNLIWFKWDIGHKFITERYDKRCFDFR
jgi:hypothetical protein